jgi:hypothetical protein
MNPPWRGIKYSQPGKADAIGIPTWCRHVAFRYALGENSMEAEGMTIPDDDRDIPSRLIRGELTSRYITIWDKTAYQISGVPVIPSTVKVIDTARDLDATGGKAAPQAGG